MALPFGEVTAPAPEANFVSAPQDGSMLDAPTHHAQALMGFILRLRARGIGNVDILRALETVPRDLFVPYRLVDLAWRDMSLPIACGQTMPSPMVVARILASAQIMSHHRVLEIGTGSGYTTAILARLCHELVSCDRFQTLATQAYARLTHMGINHAQILWQDGLNLPQSIGSFDRIIIHGSLSTLPEGLMQLLKSEGLLICAMPMPQAEPLDPAQNAKPHPHLMRVSLPTSGQGAQLTNMGPCTFAHLITGRSATW